MRLHPLVFYVIHAQAGIRRFKNAILKESPDPRLRGGDGEITGHIWKIDERNEFANHSWKTKPCPRSWRRAEKTPNSKNEL